MGPSTFLHYSYKSYYFLAYLRCFRSLRIISGRERVCPKCGGELRYFDTVDRVVKGPGGKKLHRSLDRYRRKQCRSVRRELPNDILPFKQYTAPIVEGFMSGQLSNDILEFEDYPAVSTVQYWKTQK